jgi:hypothetical protein
MLAGLRLTILQGCRARLPGKAAGQSSTQWCNMVKLDKNAVFYVDDHPNNKSETNQYRCTYLQTRVKNHYFFTSIVVVQFFLLTRYLWHQLFLSCPNGLKFASRAAQKASDKTLLRALADFKATLIL